ncbi:uncharacterized protein LOC117478147 [Trematomus bernacchii]|uniref:uncharacterized protein LOC117478147 n=1 Tax=Trematomus bernacchii TaxID=40690 RepID=UPI00146E04BF|nr:uncharacterized protein LOC117478147 [Trematomus bernacchii]
MAVCAPVYKEAGVEYSPESKPAGLQFPQKKGKTGPDYLKEVLDCVSKKNRHKIFEFKNTACTRWKIGPLEDTIYSEKPDVVNGWGKFYLPEKVSMQVVGVVEGTSCPSDQLVLMTCEDGEVYAYDGVELHWVASNLLKLRQKGIIYPGSKTYYEGEAFKDMTKEDCEEVRNRPTGKRLEQEHLKLVTENKDRFMEYLKATAAIKATMEFDPVANKEAGGECSPESKSLHLLFGKKGRKGPYFLKEVLDCVSKERHEIFELKKPAGAKLKIGPLEDTIYRGKPDVVDEWGEFYLPEIVSMQVVGVVEGTSCPWDQLVLMICEDGKLFAYDGEELHLVASNMKQVDEKGIRYPGSKRYYKGQAFKDKTEEDWEEVWKSPTGKRLDQEHLELVTENKATFMECLKATAAIKARPSQKLVTSP